MAKDEDGNNKAAAEHQGDETQAEEEETRHEWVYDTYMIPKYGREREGRHALYKQTKDYTIATTRT